jgi:Pre-mRNA splicing factor PRP21 like protein
VDAEKVAFRSIDWQDFVVVETIDFPEDELTGVTYGAADEDMDVEMDMVSTGRLHFLYPH